MSPEPETTRRAAIPAALWPLALVYLVVAMNMTIASVALPTISTEFLASASQLAWVVNATPLAGATLILFAGGWGDRIGRKRLLLIGITVFVVAAVLSGTAANVDELIVLRALTGVGSALVLPAALALTFDITSEQQRRTSVGIMGSTQAIGALLGPLLGGAALVLFDWRAAFWAVVPMLLIALVCNAVLLPKDGPRGVTNEPPLDSFGAALTALAGIGILYAAISLAPGPDSAGTPALVSFAIGVAALVALAFWERRCTHPLFEAAILRRTGFWVPTLVIFLVQFCLGGLLFITTQYVQLVLGLSALAAAGFLMPALLVWTVAAATAGITSRTVGAPVACAAGLGLAAIGLVLVGLNGRDPNYAEFIVGLLLIGAMGIAPALMTAIAVDNYPPERRGVGSAINSAAVRFGLAFGVGVFATILAIRYQTALTPALVALPAEQAAIADNNLGSGLQVADRLGGQAGDALADSARTAFVEGFHLSLFIAAAVVAALAVISGLLLPKDSRTTSNEHLEVEA